jgi:predicted nucleic acid-binding protein
MGQLADLERVGANERLGQLRRVWREVAPSGELRKQAEDLMERFSLRAADSLQLAAAMAWCQSRPLGRAFICGDGQLLDAARLLHFKVIEA